MNTGYEKAYLLLWDSAPKNFPDIEEISNQTKRGDFSEACTWRRGNRKDYELDSRFFLLKQGTKSIKDRESRGIIGCVAAGGQTWAAAGGRGRVKLVHS